MRFVACLFCIGLVVAAAAAAAAVEAKVSDSEVGTTVGDELPRASRAQESFFLQRPQLDTTESADEGRGGGLVKRAALPFLLGLKLLAGAVAPALLALVALGTWKATTLALLSLVMSGALVLLKLAAPKSPGVEVVHVPAAAPPVWEPHARAAIALGRSLLTPPRHDADDQQLQQLAFRAHAPTVASSSTPTE